MEIVVQEIMQEKIFLDTSSELRITGEIEPAAGGEPVLDFDRL